MPLALGANFKIDVKSLRAGLREANQLIKETESKFKLSTVSMKDWGSSADGVKARLDALNTTMKIQEEKVRALDENYKKELSKGMEETEEKASRLRTEMNKENTALEKNRAEAKELAEKLKDMESGADDAGDAMEKAGEQAEESAKGWTIGRDVIAEMISNVITAGISKIKEFGKEALNVGKNFSAAMSEVSAISGATAEEQAILEEKARELSRTSKFTASEVAQGFKYMALAGWSVQDSIDGISGILDLAAASGMDLAKASDTVTDYLTAFGLEAKDSARLADLLAFAQANANTSAEQLTEAYGNSAAQLAAAGQDVETVTSLLSMMANRGLKGSEAGTALAAVMRDITSKMDDGKIAIGDTAVTVADAEGNFRDLTDILADVEKATTGMGTAERAAAVSTTFTARSLKGLNLILNAGTEEAKSFENRLRTSTGAASDMADVMQDNLAGDVTKMKSALEDAELELYKKFEPTLRSAAQTITKKVIPGIKDFIVKMKDNKVVRAFGDGIKYIVTHLKDVIPIAIAAVTAIKGFKIASTLTTTISKFGGAVKGLSGILSANPLGLAITAVAGIATGIAAISAAQRKAEEDALEASRQKANVQYFEDQAEAISNSKTTWDDFVKDVNQSTFDNIADINYYSRLYDELKTIVDENGKVKDGYEERGRFIVNELNEGGLLDKELKFNEGVIEDYKTLQSEISKTIQLKRIEAILAGEQELAEEARKQENTLALQYTEAKNALPIASRNIKNDFQKEIYPYLQNNVSKDVLKQYQSNIDSILAGVGSLEDYTRIEQLVNGSFRDFTQYYNAFSTAIYNVEDAWNNYSNNLKVQAQYQADYTKFLSGETDKMAEISERQETIIIQDGKVKDIELQNQLDMAEAKYKWLLEESERGNKDITNSEVESQRKRVEELGKEVNASKPTMHASFKDLGKMGKDGFISGINPLRENMKNALSKTVADVKSTDTEMKTAGKRLGTALSNGIVESLQNSVQSVLSAASALGRGAVAESQAAIIAAEVAGRNTTNYTINQNNTFAVAHSDYEVYKARKLLEDEIRSYTRGY